jgi:hypothetical protein
VPALQSRREARFCSRALESKPGSGAATVSICSIEEYIQAGDHVRVVHRGSLGDLFTGRVLEVRSGTPGAREVIIVRDGQDFTEDGAAGFSESNVVLAVERGESWVNVPPLLTLEQAQQKVVRNAKNQRRRLERDFPLFSDQADVHQQSAVDLVDNCRASAQRDLDRDEAKAAEATDLRSQVQALVTADEYLHLLKRRAAYPPHAIYGVLFWRKQLLHIQATGRPDILPPPPPSVKEALSIPWLRLDGPATWKSAPGGPQPVKVLFFGRTEILCRLTAQPLRDYDPVLIPKTAVWLPPSELAPEKRELS